MSTFPLWVERLFLFLDEWLFLCFTLYLFFKWVGMKMAALRLDGDDWMYERSAVRFQERAYLAALLVWVIVGAIFVYGVGYPMFFYHWRDEAPRLCSYIAQR